MSQRIPVIIDTDPGVDDTLAILLALASPELQILAITITFGNTDLDACWLNVLKIFDVLARYLETHPEEKGRFVNFGTYPIILAKGSAMPLEGALHSAQYFHGRDGLSDITSRHPEFNISSSIVDGKFHSLVLANDDACAVSLQLIREHTKHSITYIALGPLTTLAHMMRIDGPMVSDRLGRVICMGGALDVPGNTSPVAEFNFFADPYAVREILGLPSNGGTTSKGFPLDRFVLLPLDITTRHELHLSIYASRVDSDFQDSRNPSNAVGKPFLHHFTSSFLERTREVMNSYGKDAVELHDVVAVWCASLNPVVVGPENRFGPIMQSGWEWVARTFNIERTGELTRGMLVVDRREENIGPLYAPGTNRAEMEARSKEMAAPVQINTDENPSLAVVAVPCVVKTPGPDELLRLLLERVWGVNS